MGAAGWGCWMGAAGARCALEAAQFATFAPQLRFASASRPLARLPIRRRRRRRLPLARIPIQRLRGDQQSPAPPWPPTPTDASRACRHAVDANKTQSTITRSAARRAARPCPEERFRRRPRRRRAPPGTARRWYVGPATGAAAPTRRRPRFPWRRRTRLRRFRHHHANTRPCRRCASAFLTPGPR